MAKPLEMADKKFQVRPALIIGMLVLAAISRLLPHPSNFSPMGAMALFGAAYFAQRYLAFLIPLAAIWLTNLTTKSEKDHFGKRLEDSYLFV